MTNISHLTIKKNNGELNKKLQEYTNKYLICLITYQINKKIKKDKRKNRLTNKTVDYHQTVMIKWK